MMAGQVIRFFAGGNTSRGFYSLYDWALAGLDKVFFLLGGPGTGKSTLMKKIAEKWSRNGYSIELMHSPLEPDAVEGVVIPELKTAVVSGKILRHIDVRAPGVVEEFLDLNSGLQTEKLAPMKDQILGLHDETANRLKAAYQSFAEALRIHDDWEKIYIDNIDFEKADELTEKLAGKFFENKYANKKAHEKRRFLGAATPEGSVDFVPDITAGLEKRYFIKGRAGSGKSTMLKKIAAEGLKRGFDAEIYQCGFDPESLDMVLFRELGFAIFDSTKPHEYFPSREGDEIIELYGTIIDPDTDERHAGEIEEISRKYRKKINEAVAHLAEAKAANDRVEEIYQAAMDFTVADAFFEKVDAAIRKMAR